MFRENISINKKNTSFQLPFYYHKNDMLEHTNKLVNDALLHITYLDRSGHYRFTYFKEHKDLFDHINNLKINNRYYIHEIVSNGQKRKPYLDIEKSYPTKEIMEYHKDKIIAKLQNDIIIVFKKEYNETITKDDIIMLDSSGKKDNMYKLSLHIIISPKDKTYYYINSKYTNSSAYHLYTSLMNLHDATTNINYEGLLDPTIYNSNLNFRIIGSHKNFDDDRCLLPINFNFINNINCIIDYESDNDHDNDKTNNDSDDVDNDDGTDSDESEDVDDDSEDDEDNKIKNLLPNNRSATDYLLTCIHPNNIKLNTPIVHQTVKVKTLIAKNTPNKTNINKYLFDLVKKYHPTAIDNGLYKDIYHNFSYTDRTEKCPISGKIHDGTNGFYVFENEKGYFLKCFSKNCKGAKHIGYADIADDFINNALQLNQQYLIMKDNIFANDELVCKSIRTWLENRNIKTLAIKSAMGTGKTTMIEKILQYDLSIKKILWITHRQSLTKQLYGKFKKFNFKNYMDVNGSMNEYDRVIVQIDSLERILSLGDGSKTFNIYDLVIIDEIEGNLNHYNSPYINKNNRSARELFNFMIQCVQFAKKLLVIDADIGIRTKLFIDHIGKSIIINNNYKSICKNFIISNDKTEFFDDISDKIKDGKNICIVSMTSTMLNKIELILQKSKIKYVMHTSKTDDKLKNKLEDVDNFWTNYQVVLYSPCIESGIDFNKEHFDHIYCIIKHGHMTCSQRAFLQMVGRIRKIKNNDILCYYNGTSELNASIYTYNDILNYFRYYETLNDKKLIENIKYETNIIDNQVVMKMKHQEISLFDNISIYNEVEQLNKHSDTFITVLKKLIQKSGHNFVNKIAKIVVDKKTEMDEIKNNDIDDITDVDETEYDLKELMKKQSNSKLNDYEKLVLEKFFFNKTFGIKCTKNDEEFKRFYHNYRNKIIIFKRFEKLFGYIPCDTNINDGKKYDNLNDGKDKLRHNIILDLIKRLVGKDINNVNDLIDIKIGNKDYIKAVHDIAQNSIYFENEQGNRALFHKSKKDKMNLDNDKNLPLYTRFLKNILADYGISLSAHRVRNNNTRFHNYEINVDIEFKKIADFKHKKTYSIDIYKDLFVKIVTI